MKTDYSFPAQVLECFSIPIQIIFTQPAYGKPSYMWCLGPNPRPESLNHFFSLLRIPELPPNWTLIHCRSSHQFQRRRGPPLLWARWVQCWESWGWWLDLLQVLSFLLWYCLRHNTFDSNVIMFPSLLYSSVFRTQIQQKPDGSILPRCLMVP